MNEDGLLVEEKGKRDLGLGKCTKTSPVSEKIRRGLACLDD